LVVLALITAGICDLSIPACCRRITVVFRADRGVSDLGAASVTVISRFSGDLAVRIGRCMDLLPDLCVGLLVEGRDQALQKALSTIL
jgi:hypothetical protein